MRLDLPLKKKPNRQARAKDLDFLAEEYTQQQERARYPQNNKNRRIGNGIRDITVVVFRAFFSNAQEIAHTGSIKDSLEITKEELKYIRDIAEREIINRYTTAEVKVEMVNNNSIASDVDADACLFNLLTVVKKQCYCNRGV